MGGLSCRKVARQIVAEHSSGRGAETDQFDSKLQSFRPSNDRFLDRDGLSSIGKTNLNRHYGSLCKRLISPRMPPMAGHVDQQTFMPLTAHPIFDLAAD